MDSLKKIGIFFALFAILIGAGCAIGWNFYEGQVFSGICCIVLTLAAVPTFVKLVKELLK